jgi:hypothetical protein
MHSFDEERREKIGAAGFEPAISAPQKPRDTRLRYAPMALILLPFGA